MKSFGESSTVIQYIRGKRSLQPLISFGLAEEIHGRLCCQGYRIQYFVKPDPNILAYTRWLAPLLLQIHLVVVCDTASESFQKRITAFQAAISQLLKHYDAERVFKGSMLILDQQKIIFKGLGQTISFPQRNQTDEEDLSKLKQSRKAESIFLHKYIQQYVSSQQQPDELDFQELLQNCDTRRYDLPTVLRTVHKIIGKLALQHKVDITASEEWIVDKNRPKSKTRRREESSGKRRIDLVMRRHGMIVLVDWKFSYLQAYKIAEKEVTKMAEYVRFYSQENPGMQVVLLNAVIHDKLQPQQSRPVYRYQLQEYSQKRLQNIKQNSRDVSHLIYIEDSQSSLA